MCTKPLTSEAYTHWAAVHHAAEVAIEGRSEKLEEAFGQLETELELVGCTGVEDKLQDECAETIDFFTKCGVRVWVLTGDKVDTAMSVGHACNLLKEHTHIVPLVFEGVYADWPALPSVTVLHRNAGTEETAAESAERERLQKAMEGYMCRVLDSLGEKEDEDDAKGKGGGKKKKKGSDHGYQGPGDLEAFLARRRRERGVSEVKGNAKKNGGERGSKDELRKKIEEEEKKEEEEDLALVVDGQSLYVILSSETLTNIFLHITDLCAGVVCCRISPIQKALIVRAIKSKRKTTTLAIGDGANDVSMIQEAHVGIGISGLEGLHASQNSDYAIAQFRFLRRLMCVHGHWNGYRLASLLKYSFYKNILYTFLSFFFQFYCGFSLQMCFDDYFITFYNLIFTSIPPLVTAIFDQDLPAWLLERAPSIYRHNQHAPEFGIVRMGGWVLIALIHGVIQFWVVLACFHFGQYTFKPYVGGLDHLSMFFGIVTLTSIMCMCAWNHRYYTILPKIALFGSYIILYMGVTAILAFFPGITHFSFFQVLSSWPFWSSFAALMILMLAIPMLFSYLRREYFPLEKDRFLFKYMPGQRMEQTVPTQCVAERIFAVPPEGASCAERLF